MHGEKLPEDATMPDAVHGQLDRPVRPWGWHAGDGTPAHPADRVAQWPAHNKARMTHAVYAEADTLALADQVLTLNNALRDAERQRDALRADLDRCTPPPAWEACGA